MPISLSRQQAPRAVLVCLVLSLYVTCTWLMNVTAYPGFDGFFPMARDIATTFGGVVAAALIPLAMRRPAALLDPRSAVAAALFALLGAAGMFVAAVASSPVLATAFACLHSAVTALGALWLVVNLVELPAQARILVLVGAYLLKYAWMACLWRVPFSLKSALFVVLSGAALIMLGAFGARTAHAISQTGTPESLSLTNPLSFVPITSRVFVSILLCSAALGFALTYGSQNSYPPATIWAVILVGATTLWVLLSKTTSIDLLFSLVFAFILAGILFGMTGMEGSLGDSLSNTLLQAGSDVTSVVVWFVVAAIGERNRSGIAPTVLATTFVTSLGTELGAASGHVENYLLGAASELASLFMAAIALGFALCIYHLGRTFSFDATVAAVRPAEEVAPVEERDERVPRIERRCAQLAQDGGLTPREAEVLELLARGRNAAYIQEQLTLSRNTVKSYVARVYGKLGVHSHQELIDLVEDA